MITVPVEVGVFLSSAVIAGASKENAAASVPTTVEIVGTSAFSLPAPALGAHCNVVVEVHEADMHDDDPTPRVGL